MSVLGAGCSPVGKGSGRCGAPGRQPDGVESTPSPYLPLLKHTTELKGREGGGRGQCPRCPLFPNGIDGHPMYSSDQIIFRIFNIIYSQIFLPQCILWFQIILSPEVFACIF